MLVISSTVPLETLDPDTVETYYKDSNALLSVTIDEDKMINAVQTIRENENCRGNSTLSVRLRELSRPEKVCGPALKRKKAHPGTDTGSAAG